MPQPKHNEGNNVTKIVGQIPLMFRVNESTEVNLSPISLLQEKFTKIFGASPMMP